MSMVDVTSLLHTFTWARGGFECKRVHRIPSENRDALNAIHDFLTFQIADHQTGDAAQP